MGVLKSLGDVSPVRGLDMASATQLNERDMSNGALNWIANYIWGIADDVLRDLYVRGKYRDVILPMTVLRRLDAVLEGSKQAVLDMKATLDDAGVVEQDPALRQAAGQAFYNTFRFTLRDLRARANRQQLTADFQAYLDGFSPNVQDILDNFEFRNQIARLSRADALGTLIEKLTSPDINVSPDPVRHTDGSVKHPGLDNHGMGTIFEELVRRLNEENNEEAGEHWTPRDAVRLMAKLVFLPIADRISSGTYLLYDDARGTGGMLTLAEETLRRLAAEHGKEVAAHLYGQEINAETYAIRKADLLLKREVEASDNILIRTGQSTPSNEAFPSHDLSPTEAMGLLFWDTASSSPLQYAHDSPTYFSNNIAKSMCISLSAITDDCGIHLHVPQYAQDDTSYEDCYA